MSAMEIPPPSPPPPTPHAKSALKRPGFLPPGIILSALGTGAWIWDGIAISSTVASCNRARLADQQNRWAVLGDDIACGAEPLIEVPVGIAASSVLIAGIAFTIVSFTAEPTKRSGPLYDLTELPTPAFRLAVTPEGIAMRGTF
jgi:hypothetical protein